MQPEMTGFLERIRAFTDRWPGRVLLGEVSAEGDSLRRSARYTDGSHKRLHTAYALGFMQSRSPSEKLGAVGDKCERV